MYNRIDDLPHYPDGGRLMFRTDELDRVCRAFSDITAKAGLDGEPRFTFHSLRAVYAALMVERGITSTVLASQMGHADSSVTERKYVHLFNRVRTDEAVRDAIQGAMG
ncbi:MAG TPA: tyrosine-type recombinase/integrase [Gaiellaceae bacterium]|nr:tyrosine-type recombinase/integrase [Gaiellaceae bacterium]